MGKRRSKKGGTNAAAWFYGQSFNVRTRREEHPTERVQCLELPPAAAYRPLPHEEQRNEIGLPPVKPVEFSDEFPEEETTAPGWPRGAA